MSKTVEQVQRTLESIEAADRDMRAELARLRDGCKRLSRALSQIDYLFGEPNEMECSTYDIQQNENAVVELVRKTIERLKLLAAPEPPPGEWQKTHRVVAVRPAKEHEDFLMSFGGPIVERSKSDWATTGLAYIVEPLDPPKPAFVCPPHLKGFGKIKRCEFDEIWWTSPDGKNRCMICDDGEITNHGKAMGFTSMPELEPGQEINP